MFVIALFLHAVTPVPRAALGRRSTLAAAAGAFASPTLLRPTFADEVEGGAQWELTLPDRFAIARRLASIVRIRVETMLSADDGRGTTAKLLLLPLGQQTAGSLTADEQLLLARYFIGGGDGAAPSSADVAAALAASARRSPTVLSLALKGAASESSRRGRRYVAYEYAAAKCAGEIDGGDCLGTTSARRNLAVATVAPISQYRTNTERARMAELGQERNVDVLWLLTLSADEAAWSPGLSKELEGVAGSFVVT